ncbi:MAG: ribulokinase [Phycisphaerae bacterium]|nr:ribulokinase [Phycisphaerae bacterium]MDW8261646.1 ribulokinase [Phycisphaerales bacterium]
MTRRCSLGLDFGTESARAVIVDIADGSIVGQATCAYTHGVIDRQLPDSSIPLPADYALQHPRDWLESAAAATRGALAQAQGVTADHLVGIGVDFTSCTMLPCTKDGTPLCLLDRFRTTPLAWPKLWKHHGAKAETDRINRIARERNEPWLPRYGGTVGLEWFFPKILETLHHAPEVFDAAEIWIEAGDWLVWQLVSGPFPGCDPNSLTRSTCQAGYKALWNRTTGYPSAQFLAAVHPKLSDIVPRALPGVHRAPGEPAGRLSESAARMLGLRSGIAVSTAIIDAHAGVPGAGAAEPDTMVLVMGTSSCHMLNSRVETFAEGIAGVVEGGILPGYFGYETGQASVGDAFAWLVETFGLSHEQLSSRAARLPPGSGGVIALDWLNGCRTPLMDGRLSGALVGLTLGTRPEQLYRALMEATAFGLRWIVQTLRDAQVPVRRFVASGGLPARNPLLMQIYADVLQEPISLAESEQSVALGAAIIGCVSAGEELTGYRSVESAIRAMARQRQQPVYRPSAEASSIYQELYQLYRQLADPKGTVATTMHALHELRG